MQPWCMHPSIHCAGFSCAQTCALPGLPAATSPALCFLTAPAGVPLNVTYYGGIGKVTVLWESPAVDPDPTSTKYRLYATPLPAEGRRRLLEEQQTSIAALVPSRGDGSVADPFNATIYLPGGSGGQGARLQQC